MLFLSSFNRLLPEVLHQLAESKSRFTCACPCSLVSLSYLSISVFLKNFKFFFDFVNEFFHKNNCLVDY
jgi:hypothetical protein